MKKTIIGIAGNQLLEAADVFHGNQVTYTPQGFVNAVQEAGGLPLVFPIGSPDLAEEYIRQIDKLLLAGGQDVDPRLYDGQPHPKLGMTNLDRDSFEKALVLEAIKQKKPIMAVCRGMQLVNSALGGSLYQDLSLYSEWSVKHEQQPTDPRFATHSVQIEKNSVFSKLLPETYMVNSYHHQAVKRLAPSLKAVAWADDGTIEALESNQPDGKILGVQWHPELRHQVEPLEQGLFNYFVQEF